MQVLRDLADLGRVSGKIDLAIGVFDGVHRGHRHVVDSAVSGRGRPVVLTFDPHPIRLLRPDLAPLELTLIPHKARLLGALGAEFLLPLHFDRARAQQGAEDFVAELRSCAELASVSVGLRFRFGHERRGDIDLLRDLGAEAGFAAHGIEPVCDAGGEVISSTRVRAALAAGDLAVVREMLDRDYSIFGYVSEGSQLGRTIGFATANVADLPGQLPPFGVYAVELQLGDRRLPGVANLGVRPTVGSGGEVPLLEVHLFDFDEGIYGAEVEVFFKAAIREERKFDGLDALRKQIASDVEEARRALASA